MIAVPTVNGKKPQLKQSVCPALSVDNISAGYPGNRQVIEQISFEINRGERIAMIGPNGAGKSTLFKTLIGLLPHTTGHISIHGEDCRTSHTLIGYVPQSEAIDWNFPVTVEDVVMMGRVRKIGWLRLPRRDDYDFVHTVLDQVGMAHLRHRQIGQLSGGQKRRVFIARALAQETDVLLLDEPFSGIDVAAENEIMETLDQLQRDHITVLLATHDLSLASTHFNRLLLIKNTVVAFGTPDEVLTAENLKQAYGGRVGIFQGNHEAIIVLDEH